MKKRNLFILSLLMLIVLSFSTASAQTLVEPNTDHIEHLEHFKEIRHLIMQLQDENASLQKQIEQKFKLIDQLLVEIPEDKLADQESLQNELKQRIDSVNDRLNSISEVQMSVWKYLKAGKNQIASKNHKAGFKQMVKAVEALKTKRDMLIKLNGYLDEFMEFLKSMEYK